jgi:hypothetical protein
MIYFLASIPRSGSTLLASLLGQREDTYVSPTSNLGELMGSVVQSWENNPATQAGECKKDQLYDILQGIMQRHYLPMDQEIIFDKGRMWPSPTIMKTMEKVTGEPIKIVATVRPIAECIASFYEIDMQDDGFPITTDSLVPKPTVKEWIKTSQLYQHLMTSYQVLKEGYEKYPTQFCLVEYDDLVSSPQGVLDRISKFIGVEPIDYNPAIDQVEENDNAWGVKDLHKLESTIQPNKNNARKILGEELYEHYQGGEFWNDNPEPVREPKPIDIALEAGLHGRFDKGWEILSHQHKNNPDDNRIAFNLGWYEMMRGNLNKGHRMLDRGRPENVFGTPNIGFNKPLWNGQRNKKILVEMEGGFGDQFYAMRHIKTLVDQYQCEVIVGGCMPLAPIMRQIEGVTAIVEHEGSHHVDCDYWVPSMSLEVPLGIEFSDVDGASYIPRLCESERKVGVKWSGNPMFEHEQHRLFPSELMFNTVNDEDCISLQKDVAQHGETDGLVAVPSWMETVPLDTWTDTQMAISKCDLVVTSCTGVAHLASAMGVETWVVVPILPYYLWALPGNKTPHYDSVTLYRQEKYGCWEAPFKKIKQDLLSRKVKNWPKPKKGGTTEQFIEG